MLPRLPLRIALSLTAALLVAAPMQHTSRAASDEAEAAVAGRLGGTLETFIERFGESVTYIPAMGPLYDIEGFGFFTVYVEGYGNEPDPDRTRRLNRINMGSPRPLDRPATEPDAADWTIADATERVVSLLPTDAELSELGPFEDGQRSATCESAALDEIYAQDPAVRCHILLIMPTPETVSYAVLTLSRDASTTDEQTAGITPCAGVVDWIKAAGDRLAEIQELIAQVGTIDETDPEAAATLRALATTFRDLAADQRRNAPPDVAAQANFFLVSALTTYAKAIETAADGVEKSDAALIDAAVETFDEAGGHVAKVNGEIEQASEDCALQLGTPVPAASPIPSPAP